MASLADRITAGFQRVRDQFNTIKPRLIPAGGTTNAFLSKTSAADYAVAWVKPVVRFGFFCQGKPTASEVFGPFVADVAFTLPNGMATSIANSGSAYTAATVWTLKNNGTAVATVTFAAGASVGTIATSSAADVAIARGDRLTLTASATVDSTGVDTGFTFIGTR